MSHSCALHTNVKTYLTMEKSVQCENISNEDVDMVDTEKENHKVNVNDDVTASIPMTNGHTPFLPTVQSETSMTSKDLQPQPLVKAISEEKYPFLWNILGKKVKDDMNMEILDFHSKGKFAVHPLQPKSSSLVTFIKFQQGEFVEVKSSSSYNSSMCLRDMKNAITTALDSCISQSNPELSGAPGLPRSSPRRDMLANNTNESCLPEKSNSPKRSPPKTLRVAEGNTGTSVNITSTLEVSKDSPQGTSTGSKGTYVELKGATEGQKGVAEKSKKVPGKVKEKNSELLKEISQPSKEKLEPFKPKPAKPAQATKVKKLKIPDEESIKFANRQKEIMRMKKELKERLKREGKDGVDPATRLNAWGRTVGVTCTMCGHHVQKSYGCFRRDTAPERLIHLFTPGMNRIKICRRCLPYKKHAGKDGVSRVLTKPGLKAMASDPGKLNTGTKAPIAIAPLSDKPVSATTLNAIHRKVTADQGSTGPENMPHVSITPGHVNPSVGLVNMGSGHVNNIPGQVNTSYSRVNIGSTLVNNSAGQMNIISGHINTGTDHVNTGSSHVNNESSHMINTTAPCLPPEIDLGQSGKTSAIEYIKKLALNLKSNHCGQQGESNMAVKREIVTPEEQVIKTPLLEHFATFTPVTPSMNMANQMRNTAESVGAKEAGTSLVTAQWKPVVNRAPVTPVTEERASFSQATDSTAMSTPPWTTVPIVLKTQPPTNIVLTSSNQITRDLKSQPLTTFVSTASQKDLKLLPAIMVPTAQNALPRPRPVLLQIQRVKFVHEKTGESPVIEGKGTDDQEKEEEIVEQSETGLDSTEVTDTDDTMLVRNIGGYTRNISGYTGNIGETTGDHQSLSKEISATEVEVSTGQFESLSKEIVSTVEDISGNTISRDVNIMGTLGDLGIQQDSVAVTKHSVPEQYQKPSDDMSAVDSKLLETRYLQPSEGLEGQLLSSGNLGISYHEHDPTVILCGSASTTTEETTMYSGGYQVIDREDSGQERILEASTSNLPQSCVRNIFESQVSEEYLPQEVFKQVCDEKLNEMNKVEQESVKEFVSEDNNEHLLPKGGILEEKILANVDISNVQDDLSEDHLLESKNSDVGIDKTDVENITSGAKDLERMDEDNSVEKKEDGEKMEEGKDDQKKGLPTIEEDGSHEEIKEDKMNVTTKPSEKQEAGKVNETKNARNKELTLSEMTTTPASLAIDENVPFDRRRSQRRVTNPRKSPSKSPAKTERKIEPKVHSTRQTTQRKKETEQGAHKDKLGQQVTQKDKMGYQESQKDEKEYEGGMKRKRSGRVRKATKTDEDDGSSDLKISKHELVKESRNSPSKRMKTRKD